MQNANGLQVLALWFALNEHVAWTSSVILKSPVWDKRWIAVAGDSLTLGFLIEDYIAHMQHHLATDADMDWEAGRRSGWGSRPKGVEPVFNNVDRPCWPI